METQKLTQEQRELAYEAEYEKLFGHKMIVKDGVYCGEHAKNQTLEGFIDALNDFADRYCKDYTHTYWVQDWQMSDCGGGHYENYPAKGYDIRADLGYYCVVKAFPEFNFKTLLYQAQQFNSIPSGGYYNVTGLIKFITQFYLEEERFSIDKVFTCKLTQGCKYKNAGEEEEKSYLELTSPSGKSVILKKKGCDFEAFKKYADMFRYAEISQRNTIDYRKKTITVIVELTKKEMQAFLELSKN
jgi:hypothetical protein